MGWGGGRGGVAALHHICRYVCTYFMLCLVQFCYGMHGCMYVCRYVCMYARGYVCVYRYVITYVYLHLWMYVCV